MPLTTFRLLRPVNPLTYPVSRRTTTFYRYASDAPKRGPALPPIHEEPVNPLSGWKGTVYKISNFAIIPSTLLYAVFFADFGEHEHVFSPPRRWLERQTAAFFSLSPAERELVQPKSDSIVTEGAEKPLS